MHGNRSYIPIPRLHPSETKSQETMKTNVGMGLFPDILSLYKHTSFERKDFSTR